MLLFLYLGTVDGIYTAVTLVPGKFPYKQEGGEDGCGQRTPRHEFHTPRFVVVKLGQGIEGSFDINKSLTKSEERPHQYRRESVMKVCKKVGITTA